METNKLPTVTIVTATLGTSDLQKNLDSVAKQDYAGEIEHLVVFDGLRLFHRPMFFDYSSKWVTAIELPFNTGYGGYNGHKIYGASTFFASGSWLIFLDEDNTIEPNHVSSLVSLVTEKNLGWAYSLRNIVDRNHSFVCRDDCESLGKWPAFLGYHLVDVNCFFLHKSVALELSKFWYRRARHPDEQPEVDRLFTSVLLSSPIDFDTTGLYTVNYKAGNTERSVKQEFFLEGNSVMKKRFEQETFPWSKQ